MLRVDLSDAEATADAVRQADPDLVMLFFESWNQRRFDEAVGASVSFSQDNHSCSSRGVLRGLHDQLEPEPRASWCAARWGPSLMWRWICAAVQPPSASGWVRS